MASARVSIMGCVLAVSCWISLSAPVFAQSEPPLTAAEHSQVDQLATSTQTQCETELSKIPVDPKTPESLRGLMAFGQSPQYCACIGDVFRKEVTPALVRHGTAQQGADFMRAAANRCAVAQFKASWPPLCGAMANTLSGTNTRAIVDEACSCIQPTVDAITPETLAETVRQSVADYQDYQRNPNVSGPERPLSFVRPLKACIAKAKKDNGQGAKP